MKKIKASVLIANYNNQKYINDCLRSLVQQTYKNFDLIVDPHTAVGLVCAEKLEIKGAMCLACAHPIKFQDTVKKSINEDIKYEKNFKFEHEEKFDLLKNNYPTMKEYIQNHA